MPKRVELTDMAVKKAKPGRYAVGGRSADGLLLQVLDSGARSWILRYSWGTRPSSGEKHGGKPVQRRREIGLGGYPAVSLTEARGKAADLKRKIADGIDPIEEKRASRRAVLVGRGPEVTFAEAAKQYIADHSPSWRNEKHAQQWENTLAKYAEPVIGKLSVRDVSVGHVLQIIKPIWSTKTETAKRVQSRIESIMDWSKAHGYRDGENPAAWKGHLDQLLASPNKLKSKGHHPALPANRLGKFMQQLRAQQGNGARSLEFVILTATRSGEVRGARWEEIDLKKKVWTVPADRTKTRKEHRVPLSPSALAVLKSLPRKEEADLVFPSPSGKVQSDATLAAVIARMHEAEVKAGRIGYVDPKQLKTATPHGFRSTFRDWTAEHTNYPREVAEMALAHAIGNQVEAAYRRGDLFEKRSALMGDWAAFCGKL
jgi:integrase